MPFILTKTEYFGILFLIGFILERRNRCGNKLVPDQKPSAAAKNQKSSKSDTQAFENTRSLKKVNRLEDGANCAQGFTRSPWCSRLLRGRSAAIVAGIR